MYSNNTGKLFKQLEKLSQGIQNSIEKGISIDFPDELYTTLSESLSTYKSLLKNGLKENFSNNTYGICDLRYISIHDNESTFFEQIDRLHHHVCSFKTGINRIIKKNSNMTIYDDVYIDRIRFAQVVVDEYFDELNYIRNMFKKYCDSQCDDEYHHTHCGQDKIDDK